MISKDKRLIKTENMRRLNYRGFFIISMLVLGLVWFLIFRTYPNGIQKGAFFYDRNDWFMDFYNTVYYSINRNPYVNGGSYLALIYIILLPFANIIMFDGTGEKISPYLSRYTQLGGILGMVYMTVSFILLFYMLYKVIKGREISRVGIIAALFASSTVISNYDRGNLIIFTAALLFIFIYSLDSESKVMRQIGLISLALASVSKIFPCFFGVLLLYKKRYKDFLAVIVYGLLFTLVPFTLLKGGFTKNFIHCIKMITGFEKSIAGGQVGFAFSGNTIFNTDIGIPSIVGKIICMAALLFAKYLKEDWKKILLITLSMIMFSGTQLGYSTIYLFYPIVLFLNAKHTKKDLIYLLSFIIILMPIQYSAKIGIFWIVNMRMINTIFIILTTLLTAESIYRMFKSQRRKKAEAACEMTPASE